MVPVPVPVHVPVYSACRVPYGSGSKSQPQVNRSGLYILDLGNRYLIDLVYA